MNGVEDVFLRMRANVRGIEFERGEELQMQCLEPHVDICRTMFVDIFVIVVSCVLLLFFLTPTVPWLFFICTSLPALLLNEKQLARWFAALSFT